MIKVVIFDLDDTLYDYKNNDIRAITKVRDYVKKNFGLDNDTFNKVFELTKKDIKKKLGKNSASSHNRTIYFKQFLQRININPCVYTNVLYDLYWNTILNNITLFDGVLELFEFLKSQKINIAICSNLTTNIQIKKINQLKISEYVDYLITSEEVGVEKPNRLIFLNVLNFFKVEPQEAIFIGDDFKCDIIGARKVGIEGVLISQLENSESNPKKVFRHISQEILEKNKLKL